MKLLPLKYIFTFFLIFLFSFVIFSKPAKVLAGTYSPSIWNDPFQDCGDGEAAMTKLEDPAQGGDGKPRVSVCRAKSAEGGAIGYWLADSILPLGGKNTPPVIKPRALPFLSNIMVAMYVNPPASGFAYVRDVMANAGFLAKPSYAQGIGFAGLAPLLPLWKAARNLAYTVLIIVMLAIGFMVIFRMKIDPKTVISVQAAIPRIVLTLILITFSYAIAGFMIDMMYLVIFILIELVTKSLPSGLPSSLTNTNDLQTKFVASGWWGMANLLGAVFNWQLLIPTAKQFFLGSFLNIGMEGLGGIGLGAVLAKLFAGGTFPLLGIPLAETIPLVGISSLFGIALIPVIIIIIIALGLLYTFIRLTFLLLNSYIQLIISIIIGPILLLKEAVPGQSAFGDWIKGLLANLVVFPATILIILFSWIMTAIAWKSNLWGAPLIPVGGGGDAGGEGNPLAIFIGLGIIFLAPNLVASIKKIFGAKPAVPVTAGTAFSPITGTISTGMGAMQSFYYFQQPFVKGAASGLLKTLGVKVGGSEGPTK